MMLEVAILSYNRPTQLERILSKLIGFYNDECKITVYDDRSPQKESIEQVVDRYTKNVGNLSLVFRPENYGYDRNLISAVVGSTADYVLLLSDDDFIEPRGFLDLVAEISSKSFDFGILPALVNGRWHRSHEIDVRDFATGVYDSVLFSGLVYRPRFFTNGNYSFLFRTIYSQVYLGQLAIARGNACYLRSRCIVLGGDGENYFGKSESNLDVILSDRESPVANFRYQLKLLAVIDIIDKDLRPGIREAFLKVYFVRLIALLFRIRSSSSSVDYLCCTLEISQKFPYILPLRLLLGLVPGKVIGLIYRMGLRFRVSG